MSLAGLEATTGTTIYVSTDELTSYTAADYAGITWTKVVGVVTFPQWGNTHADISEPLLSESQATHVAGIGDAGTGNIPIQYRDTDAGRVILEDEVASNTDVHFLKVYRSGSGEASTGRVMSDNENEAGGTNVRGQTIGVAFNIKRVRLTDTEVTTALGNV